MAQVARTRYAECGDMTSPIRSSAMARSIMVVLPGPFIPIDSIGAEPSMYHFHRGLASFRRVIRFDQRGTGPSSRIPSLDVIGPKYWAEDAIAVMHAVGCAQATIFAPIMSHAMSAFVHRPPATTDRVRSLGSSTAQRA